MFVCSKNSTFFLSSLACFVSSFVHHSHSFNIFIWIHRVFMSQHVKKKSRWKRRKYYLDLFVHHLLWLLWHRRGVVFNFLLFFLFIFHVSFLCLWKKKYIQHQKNTLNLHLFYNMYFFFIAYCCIFFWFVYDEDTLENKIWQRRLHCLC